MLYLNIPSVAIHTKDYEELASILYERYQYDSVGFSPSNYNCLISNGILSGSILEIGDSLSSFGVYLNSVVQQIECLEIGGRYHANKKLNGGNHERYKIRVGILNINICILGNRQSTIWL